MWKFKLIFYSIVLIIITSCSQEKNLDPKNFTKLKEAYRDHIQAINNDFLTWNDGEKMPLEYDKRHTDILQKIDHPTLADQIIGVSYHAGEPFKPIPYIIENDPGRIRYIPFFMKMYGRNKLEVESHLTIIYWLPKTFGKSYPLKVTRVNQVDKKLTCISKELELIVESHNEYKKFLVNPGGTFNWRLVSGTNRLSMHSFGMTIDINTKYSNYWQWELAKESRPIVENSTLTYQNQIPDQIIKIFEKYGFIWGGKWYHYDTMHFEYRPELLTPTAKCILGPARAFE